MEGLCRCVGMSDTAAVGPGRQMASDAHQQHVSLQNHNLEAEQIWACSMHGRLRPSMYQTCQAVSKYKLIWNRMGQSDFIPKWVKFVRSKVRWPW